MVAAFLSPKLKTMTYLYIIQNNTLLSAGSGNMTSITMTIANMKPGVHWCMIRDSKVTKQGVTT